MKNLETLNVTELQQEVLKLQSEIRRLRAVAGRDDLTGCLRREAFLETLKERLHMGWLHQSVTLVVVDIDHFKKVNDTYGHLGGDEVLRAVSLLLKNAAPEESLVCRMGGEEFVMVLNGNTAQTKETVETLRQNIEAHLINLDGMQIQVNASFGVTEWQSTQESLLSATARADKALYRAKNSGRNRICEDFNVKAA
jgi:diguanylate cyclase (GGDEF)-like protein